MRKHFLGTFLTLLLSVAVTPSSAPNQPLDCPKISVYCSETISRNNTLLRFSVRIAGGTPMHEISYHWTVSNGTIKKGQGTAVIEVEAASEDRQGLTGTVDVAGFDPECAHIASCSTQVREGTSFTCSQPLVEQTTFIHTAETGRYTTRRVEFIGNTYTPDHVLRDRIDIGMREGNLFTRRSLIKSLRNVNKLKIIYPAKLNDVVLQVNVDEKTVDLIICFKEKSKPQSAD